MGRPSKLNAETQKAIIDAIAVGATYETAAGAAGVDYTTFNNWMKWGLEKGHGIYFQFFNACERAKQAARLKFTKVITKAAADGDWRAALEYLKRHDAASWGDKNSETLLNVDLSSLTDDQINRLAIGDKLYDVLANKS